MSYLNTLSELWADVMIRATVHGAIAVVFVFAIGFLFSNYMTSKAQCWLWRLVFVKLLLLTIITTPIQVPILPGQSRESEFSQLDIQVDTVAADERSELNSPEMPYTYNTSDRAIKSVSSSDQIASESTWFGNFSFSAFAFAIWLGGVIACLGWLPTTWLTARRLRKSCVPAKASKLHRICQELCNHFEIKHHPELMISEFASSPLLTGAFTPKIVFPNKMLESLDNNQVKLVIAHELSHLKRQDLWWSWIPTAAQVLFFFHPFVWAAKTRWLLSREMACDELVLSVTGKSATSYADALINVSTCMSKPGTQHFAKTAFGSTCMVQTTFTLKRRIEAMRTFTKSNSISVHAAIAFGLTAIFVVIPWQPVQRQASAIVSPASSSIPFGNSGDTDERNHGFEELNEQGFPLVWAGGGNGYELTANHDARTGKFCGQIESVVEGKNPNFGTFTNGIRAAIADYHGKRVRYSGYLRSDMEPEAWAGLWMRVDGDGEGKLLAFDNMNNRPVKGKTDWTEYSVVLDIPASATNINYGFLVAGSGALWGDDLKIEVVGEIGEGPEVTDSLVRGKILNLDFEDVNASGLPTGWGGGGKGYELTRSSDAHQGESCGKIESVDDKVVFGTFTSNLEVTEYRGKRVRYSGYLRSNMEAKSWAGLWMRVDVGKVSVAFDNMQSRPVKGTTDWTEYSVVLDVPENATNINFGFLIGGHGTLWGDDLSFEIVEDLKNDPATTDKKK